MGSLNTLKEGLRAYLAAEIKTALPTVEVQTVTEFSGKNSAVPVKKPMVSVGFLSAKSEQISGDGYVGDFGGSAMRGRRLQMEISLQVAVPTKMGGDTAHEIFEAITESLLLKDNSFGISSAECSEMKFERDIDCFLLEAVAKLSTFIYANSTESMFTDFDVRRQK